MDSGALATLFSIIFDTLAPSGAANPTGGSDIVDTTPLVILFGESMDTGSATVGGTLAAESDGGAWSSTGATDDTLTVSPTTFWSPGAGRTLTVDADDLAGNTGVQVSASFNVLELILTERVIDSVLVDPFWVVAADLDGDTDPDIVGSSHNANSLVWWENTDGAGTFGTMTVIDAVMGGVNIYCVDFDEDTDIDIVCASRTDNELAWWENNGSASFTKHVIDAAIPWTYGIYAADLDGSAGLEVVCSTGDFTPAPLARLAWWTNDGSGNFTAQPDIESDFEKGISVYGGDLDNDGDIDLLQAVYGDDYIRWYENVGGGASWLPHNIDTDFIQATCVYSADVDEDGDLDVLGTSGYYDEVAWWENDGSGGFGARQRHAGSLPDYRDTGGNADCSGTCRMPGGVPRSRAPRSRRRQSPVRRLDCSGDALRFGLAGWGRTVHTGGCPGGWIHLGPGR